MAEAQTHESAGSSATARQTLTVTDNRTGKTFELPITDGTVKAMDFRQMRTDPEDFGLMTYDPAFTNTASCRSAITYIDGDRGILQHRGYTIEDLCANATYLEVAYLLVNGALPNATQLDDWANEIKANQNIHEDFKKLYDSFSPNAHPMSVLMASVSELSTHYPTANNTRDKDEQHLAAVRMIAKMPTFAAWAYRHSKGLHYVYPDSELSYAANFLNMMFSPEPKWRPNPELAKALDVLFILHADHEQNCSTNAVRSVGSSEVDPYSSVAGGIAALYGPLHGGANEQVLRMLDKIGSVDNVPEFLESVKGRHDLLMGFGHRVYKNYDPRARIIKKHVDNVLAITGTENPKLAIAVELEKRALGESYFVDRKLFPNVDFYSGLVYEALQIPTEMFTVMFAIARTSGWISQWKELVGDAEQKIARPRQIYTGALNQDFVPLDRR